MPATPVRRPRPLPTVAVLALVVLLTGCAGGTDGDRPVRVLAASSLGPVLDELAAEAPVPFEVSLAGSQVLEAQVRAGAPADVLLLADPERARALADDGLAAPPSPLVANRLAVVVRDGVAVGEVADLADPTLRVVLADAGVPLGDHTRAGLTRLEEDGDLPAGTLEAILAGADSLEDSAASVVAKLTAGEADAAIVYVTDAIRLGLTTVPVPDREPASYTAQVAGDHPRAADLVAWLRGDEARRIWDAAGFVTGATP